MSFFDFENGHRCITCGKKNVFLFNSHHLYVVLGFLMPIINDNRRSTPTCGYHCENILQKSFLYNKLKRRQSANRLAIKVAKRLIQSTRFSVERFIQEVEYLDCIHVVVDKKEKELHLMIKFNKNTR